MGRNRNRYPKIRIVRQNNCGDLLENWATAENPKRKDALQSCCLFREENKKYDLFPRL